MNTQNIYSWEMDVAAICLRYFILAGVAYSIYYVPSLWSKSRTKLQSDIPAKQQVIREILYSCSTLLIFCATSWFVFVLFERGYTKIYTTIDLSSWAYVLFSFVVCIVLHDAYFYWTHRLIHLKSLYRIVHHSHHLSTNPTPWASFAFHPLEALLATGIIPLIVFSIPIHPYTLFAFLTFMTFINVMGHLGYELFSPRFTKSLLGRWINTSTSHNLHHKKGKGNFGLYFTFWDRLMGTETHS